MTKRLEFSAKVKDQARQRAGDKCQECGLPLVASKARYDHILPDALGGKPDLANCQVLCIPCHAEKTGKEDVPRIRKADRQRRAHIGAKAAPAKTIESAGFPKREKESRHKPIEKFAALPLPRLMRGNT